MYRKKSPQLSIEDFILPFGGKLQGDNRWVKLSALIPWDTFEERYAKGFSNTGNPAKNARVALGSLLIQTRMKWPDEELVEQIRENPYLQFFLGRREYSAKPLFEASSLVHFRKRITPEMLAEVNEAIRKKNEPPIPPPPTQQPPLSPPDSPPDPPSGSSNGTSHDPSSTISTSSGESNKGKLILDATVAPQDIRYPTDLSLLNEAREAAEALIDTLHAIIGGPKPRTYREVARKEYMRSVKDRKPKAKKLRKSIRKQLDYLARDLRTLESQLETTGNSGLSPRQREKLDVIRKLYEQQKAMYDTKTHSTPNRIVSLTQPHVRPIIRGKAGANVEFGAKLTASVVDGFATVERLSWESYNESLDLIPVAEAYRDRYNYYPSVILADSIFATRENRAWCKARGIRLSGPPLGRPKLAPNPLEKSQMYRDTCERNAIEGKFGEAKRRYGLDLIMTKLKETSETSIHLHFLVMNLERLLRFLLRFFPSVRFAFFINLYLTVLCF